MVDVYASHNEWSYLFFDGRYQRIFMMRTKKLATLGFGNTIGILYVKEPTVMLDGTSCNICY